MGKPKHQAQARRHRGFDFPGSSINVSTATYYDVLRAPLDDEIIKVVGLRPSGLSVTSIRDNHQQVHEMTFPQDEE